MKAWLRLVIAVIVLAVIAGVLYWPRKAPAPAATPSLVKIDNSKVQQITITQPGQPTVAVERSGDGWKMTEPYAYAADGAAVTSLLDSLGNITGAQTIGPATNLAAFGLDKPSTIEVTLASGSPLDFQFGATTPTGDNAYLRLGSGPVEMADGAIRESVMKNAFALQDKTILYFPEEKVTAIDVTQGSKKIHLEKNGGAWPKDQQDNAQALLDALSGAQMSTMVDPAGKLTPKMHLAPPDVTLKLTWTGGNGTLDIGAKQDDTDDYARSSASPAIFTIGSYLTDDMTKLLNPPPPPPAPPSRSNSAK